MVKQTALSFTRNHMIQLYPSLMAADQLHLGNVIQKLEPYCNGFHLDVMDNQFVDNIALGTDAVNQIATHTNKHLWLHLMLINPLQLLKRLTLPKKTTISIHIESPGYTKETIDYISSHNWQLSAAINPNTPLTQLFTLVERDPITHINIMSVYPGQSGQSFISSTQKRVEEITTFLKKNNKEIVLALDGGITQELLQQEWIQKHIHVCVLGAAIFKTENPETTLQNIRTLTA